MIGKIKSNKSYSNNLSDLFVTIFNIRYINKHKDYIKVKMGLFYKSSGKMVKGTDKNYRLKLSKVLESWEVYKEKK